MSLISMTYGVGYAQDLTWLKQMWYNVYSTNLTWKKKNRITNIETDKKGHRKKRSCRRTSTA